MPRQMPLDVVEPLILAVQKRNILYNTKIEGYKNRNLTELAWKAVSDEVGRDVTFCRTTWAQLRATFNRILAHQKHLPSGSGAASKGPKWYLFHQMSFVKDHVAHGTTISSLEPALFLADTNESTAVSQLTEPGEEDSLISEPQPSPNNSGSSQIKQETWEADFELEDGFSCQKESDVAVPTSEVSPAVSTRKRKQTVEDPVQKAFLDLLHSKSQAPQPQEKDADLQVFEGLLPFIRQMTQRNKRIFVKQVTSLCMDILDSQELE